MSAIEPWTLPALASALHADPGRPLVTYYDGTSGERVELSFTTFDNWVSKIANLLSDELMLDPGDGFGVSLHPHWQSTVTLVAGWTAGLQLVLPGSDADVRLSVVGPEAVDQRSAAALDQHQADGVVLACSLRPMGGPFTQPLPDGWLDFGREVPGQPDALLIATAVGSDDVAVHTAAGPLTHAELAEQAALAAAESGLETGGRLATDANPTMPGGLAAALVGPLVLGSSVILLANCDASTKARIARQERATALHWVAG
ncbi:MAG: TIGR03089 family protein [Nocardioidaceae bacterium]